VPSPNGTLHSIGIYQKTSADDNCESREARAVEFVAKRFSGDVLLSATRHAIECRHTELGREAEIRALRMTV